MSDTEHEWNDVGICAKCGAGKTTRPCEPSSSGEPDRRAPRSIVRELRYESIGGWLVLVGISVVVTPFFFLITLLLTGLSLFDSPVWQHDDEFCRQCRLALVMQMIWLVAGLVWSAINAALFFLRQHEFPKSFIAFLLCGWLITIVIANLVPDVVDIGFDVGLVTLNTMIWVSYVCISKRVRATFVR